MRIRMGVALLAATMTLAACESTTETEDTAAGAIDDAAMAGVAASGGMVDESRSAGSPTGLFNRLAGAIPGFGGFHFARCDLVVILTDRAQAGTATGVLTPLLRRYHASARVNCPTGGSVVVKPGDYTWTELSRYLAALRPLHRMRGVSRIALSVPENRIYVQVAARALVPEVKAHAEQLGVPAGALVVVVATSGRR